MLAETNKQCKTTTHLLSLFIQLLNFLAQKVTIKIKTDGFSQCPIYVAKLSKALSYASTLAQKMPNIKLNKDHTSNKHTQKKLLQTSLQTRQRKEMKLINIAISHHINQLHSVQFHSTKLNELSQSSNAQLFHPKASSNKSLKYSQTKEFTIKLYKVLL